MPAQSRCQFCDVGLALGHLASPASLEPRPWASSFVLSFVYVQAQMEELGEKLQIIMMRMQLADDPLGNEFLRMQRVQM